jgi:hypothetical protein
MPAEIGSSNYQKAFYELTDEESKLVIEKKRFEEKFEQFLNRYRPYSSVGTTLSDPIFDKRDIISILK